VRLTITSELRGGGEPVDVDVVPGTPVSDILAAAGALGAEAFSGEQKLSPEHAAGIHPVIHGVALSARPAAPSAQPPGPHLAVVAGPDAGRLITLGSPRTIGRSSSDVRLDDPAVSRTHAVAWAMSGAAWIRDAGSTNGVQTLEPFSRGNVRLSAARGARLPRDRTVRIGDSWLRARGVAADEDTQAHTGSSRNEFGKRGPVMIGAGISAVVLAGVTGRWYVALLALVYPAIVLAPELLRRVRPDHSLWLVALPDPTVPGSAPAQLGVAVLGEEPARTALARAEVLARGRRPPDRAGSFWEPWMSWLPAPEPGDGAVILASEPPSWAARVLTPGISTTVVETQGVRSESPATLGVSERQAEFAARRLAGTRFESELPRTVRWADLERPSPPPLGAPRRLVAPIGLVRREGALPETWMLDLEALGPHVLIAGTTGAGKSALLETLVLSLAERWDPRELQLALFDFKGGAGLRRCFDVPHVGGVVTDLDERGTRRALAALGVELARRKSELASRGHASFAEWESEGGAAPRLLVVVDEFQEIGATHREFMPHVTRLAAQGRALGMHLVLATQRPSGAVTPDIRANTGVTIALRVASEAESRDLIGVPAAAHIPAGSPGRAIVAWGESRVELQVALPSAAPTEPVRIVGAPTSDDGPSLAELVVDRHRGTDASGDSPALRSTVPLWHDALPARVALEDLDPTVGIAVGLVDRAASRSRSTLAWSPATGPLVVAGPPVADRTRTLECVAAGASRSGLRPVWLPADAREAARTLALARDAPDVLILVEDALAALSALASVDRGVAAEALLARAAGNGALALGIGAGSAHRIAAHASMRVILAGGAPHDDALWSVPRELHDVPAGPGAARCWDREGWGEALIAEPPPRMAEVLVQPVPARVDRGMLRSSRAVGIGGDDAREFEAPAGPVTVIGPAGRERDRVVHVLERAGALNAPCFDAPLLAPPRARDGLVIAVSPTPRVAEELCRSGASGLVDPVPHEGRVLWVEAGVGACVQLALD
jgi:hypothetical protein